MANIYDVADAAGVSEATVSRVLNGDRNVRPKTAAAVEAAIATVGYVRRAVRPGPKPADRQGVQSGIIEFLSLGDLAPGQIFRLPAFTYLLDGILKVVEDRGMDLVLSHSAKGDVIPPILARRRADGVLLFGNPSLYPKIAKFLERVPSVWCFLADGASGQGMDHVVYDNSQVGEIAANYLLERGHQHIAFLNARQMHLAVKTRQEKFIHALGAQGITPAVFEVDVGVDEKKTQSALEKMVDQLLMLDPIPRGVFVPLDYHMVTVFNALRRRGVMPGRDIELIGCNNDKTFMDQMHPRPATIDLRFRQVGELAMEQLLKKMANQEQASPIQQRVSPVLIPAET
jgi:LacI family transcriptional regulator